uniref:EGF-like calcium-binding domain-containing protein n=1 Tax=Sinocyclocheilus anshuiensis TaxID=1608454 RepID=A0A671KED8_9TELE
NAPNPWTVQCEETNGGCEALCCNTIGSFYCKCPAGQELREDGKTCQGESHLLSVSLYRYCQQRWRSHQNASQTHCMWVLFPVCSIQLGKSEFTTSYLEKRNRMSLGNLEQNLDA